MILSLHHSPMLAASEIEAIIFLLIAAASAVFNWWKKRKQDSDWTEAEQPPSTQPHRPFTAPQPSSPPPQRKTTDWEEELRRMLEGAGVPQSPPPSPPPVIREFKRAVPPPIAPASEPPPMTRHQAFGETKIYKGHCQHCGGHIEFPSNMSGDVAACPHCHEHTALEPILETRLEKMHLAENVFAGSDAAFAHVAQIDERVAAQLAESLRHPVGLTSITLMKKRSAEIDQVVAMLRRPQTARQAILATVIFGPPKAFEG